MCRSQRVKALPVLLVLSVITIYTGFTSCHREIKQQIITCKHKISNEVTMNACVYIYICCLLYTSDAADE